MKAVFALLALACVITLPGKDKAPPDTPGEKLVLETFRINTDPISSFAFDLGIYVDPQTKKVGRMFITKVQTNTDAEDLGLQAGDEIIKLDGMPVKGMDPRVAQDSQLGAIFLNRQPGEPLNLEVLVQRTQKLTVRAQRILPGAIPP
jgi:C-terminal processing protease CtpA/Prc